MIDSIVDAICLIAVVTVTLGLIGLRLTRHGRPTPF